MNYQLKDKIPDLDTLTVAMVCHVGMLFKSVFVLELVPQVCQYTNKYIAMPDFSFLVLVSIPRYRRYRTEYNKRSKILN